MHGICNYHIKFSIILIQFCNPDTLCIILWQSLHSKFFLWSFLVMGLFRIFSNSENY